MSTLRGEAARVVYTAVFGGYDRVQAVEPRCGCDFICFTDAADLVAPGWRKIIVEAPDEPPALANRRYKMLAHLVLPQYAESLYVDGHVAVQRCPEALFDKYLARHAIAMPRHPDRRCAYEEARYCVEDGLVDAQAVERQLGEYAEAGFPRDFGLTENGVILRRHHDPRIVRLMEAWWAEYANRVRRDQISLPYLLWRERIEVGVIAEGPRLSGRYFKLKPHLRNRRHWLKTLVWYITTNRYRNVAYALAYRAYRLAAVRLPTR
jgi:hypothetical protein